MTNYVMLNNVDHKDVKIITERSGEYGDDVMYAMTFPIEFRNVQSRYPIFFHKDAETGQFIPVALFGFQDKENLFLTDEGWDETYIPMMIERNPFLIGFQENRETGGEKRRVASIDMDSPRVNETEGEAVFLELGGNTDYLERVSGILEAIHYGHEASKGFIARLLELELIESFTLEIELKDGSKNKLVGFYTINEDKLQQLDGDALGKLNSEGHLMPIFMMLASHSQMRTLVERKNALLSQPE